MKRETPDCFVQHPEKREKARITEIRNVRRVERQPRELSKRSYKGALEAHKYCDLDTTVIHPSEKSVTSRWTRVDYR
jgi:hypothetical protein